MARRKQKTSPVNIAAKKLAEKAVELRAEGMSYPDIARELKYNSRQAAHDAVNRALKEMFREPLEAMIQLDMERLDRMWTVHFLNAQAGDVNALSACMRIMERRARLLGLDAPAKTAATSSVDLTHSGMSKEELKEEALRLASLIIPGLGKSE
jgi:hypothetical protein